MFPSLLPNQILQYTINQNFKDIKKEKSLAIAWDIFANREKSYYVDKTLFSKDIIDFFEISVYGRDISTI